MDLTLLMWLVTPVFAYNLKQRLHHVRSHQAIKKKKNTGKNKNSFLQSIGPSEAHVSLVL